MTLRRCLLVSLASFALGAAALLGLGRFVEGVWREAVGA